VRWLSFDHIGQDVQYSIRLMRRAPGFAAAAIVSLALGIGANTAIFNLLDGLALRSLPAIDRPDQLFRLTELDPNAAAAREAFSYPSSQKLRDSRLLSSVLASSGPFGAPVEKQGERHLARVEIVSDNYFDALGTRTARGRPFRELDAEPAADDVAVISWLYWRQQYGADPAALGARLRLRDRDLTIVGVAPEGFSGIDFDVVTDIWVPFERFVPLTDAASRTSQRWLRVIGRLHPDATPRAAEAEVAALLSRAVRLQPGANGYSSLRRRLTNPLLFIELVVALVLLITLVNVANLTLAGSSARARELAVRRALGASRRRLVAQLFTESVVLAGAGAAGALAVGSWVNVVLLRYVVPPEQAGAAARLAFAMDARVVSVAVAMAVLASISFGLMPALAATRRIQVEMRVGAGVTPSSRNWTNRGLVAGEVAACTLVLMVAGVFLRSERNLRSQDTGYEEEHLLVADVEPPRELPDDRRDGLLAELRGRAASLPGVEVAAFSHVGQLSGAASRVRIGWPRQPTVERDPDMVIEARTTPGFFAAMGTPPIAGRDFSDRDVATTTPVAIVNEAFVRRFLAGRNPLREQFFQEGGSRSRELMQVVGVVRDTKWVNLRDDAPAIYYRPYAQQGGTPMVRFALRTSGDLDRLAATFVQVARAVDRRIMVRNVVPFREIVDRTLTTERLVARVSAVFSVLALLVAIVGVYGVLTFAVARRRREIGVRIAVGASSGAVKWMIVRESLVVLSAGFLVGIPAAIAVIRVVSAWLYGLAPSDPWTMSITVVVLTTSTIAAAFVPARQAAGIDPMVVLKEN
jgi:predicted permease